MPNLILLKGQLHRLREEYPCGVAFKPGHLIETYNVAGVAKVRKQSTAFGKCAKLFALLDDFQGGIISTDFVVGSQVESHYAQAGDLIYGLVPANAVAIVIGNFLVPNGDGTVVKATVDATQTLYVSTAASAAISNVSAITAFDKSFTIAANTLQVGDIIRIYAQGIATATNSTDTLTITLKIGSTTVVATAALDVANNDIFQIEAFLVIRTIGASGTFVTSGYNLIGPPATAAQISFFKASTTIDTTAAQAITVSATWSVASASNSVRLDVLHVELLRGGGAGASGNAIGMAEENVDNSAVAAEARLRIRII